MFSLLAVGSIALDSVQTPRGRVRDVLGGSAAYFSYAASFFAPVRLVGVVGKDFPREHMDLLASRRIDTRGLQIAEGKTFRWSGRYEGAMNAAETLSVELNVFGEFDGRVPEEFRDSDLVFLANGHPALQAAVLDQMAAPKFVACDTMNHWIESARRDVESLLGRVDAAVMNDAEAAMLTGNANLIASGREILDMGPEAVILKKGEHGSVLLTGQGVWALPAYPVERVLDPTGAGDSFAGGFMGSLAREGRIDPGSLRRAAAYGTVVSSFNVQGFSLDGLRAAATDAIEARYREFASMLALPV